MHTHHKTIRPRGISLTELLVAMALAGFFATSAYFLTLKTSRRNTDSLKDIHSSIESNKALDRISRELRNAVGFNSTSATLLGSVVEPWNIVNPAPLYSARDTCIPSVITFQERGLYVATNGIVPLPGYSKATIDNGSYLLIEPFPYNDTTAQPDASTSDGVRIAYLPVDSKPSEVTQPTDPAVEYPAIPVKDASSFKVGDYAYIWDKTNSEFFRITGVQSNAIEHDSHSFWNLPWVKKFDRTAYVQKLELATYANDQEAGHLYRDDHMSDDGFNVSERTWGIAGRNPNWTIVAQHIRNFHVNFVVRTAINSESTRTTRSPRPERTSGKNCRNELGYPFLKRVTIEMKSDPVAEEGQRQRVYARSAMSANLTGMSDESEDYSGPPYIKTPAPIPPPSLTPQPTPPPLNPNTPRVM